MSADALKAIPFAVPTLDIPFGVELWPIFEQVYTKVMGYSPTAFNFVPGHTPLSTLQATATMLITYYVTVFVGREFMKNRQPFKLNGLFMIHNLYLTLASGVMLALFVEQLVPTVWRRGVFFAICDHRGGWTKPLITLYYVCLSCYRRLMVILADASQMNYLTKYVELIDTVFLVLKKKPLSMDRLSRNTKARTDGVQPSYTHITMELPPSYVIPSLSASLPFRGFPSP